MSECKCNQIHQCSNAINAAEDIKNHLKRHDFYLDVYRDYCQSIANLADDALLPSRVDMIPNIKDCIQKVNFDEAYQVIDSYISSLEIAKEYLRREDHRHHAEPRYGI